ncbi:hypothetical protein [Halomonas caseinilytica]|uniref:hypothetical protein n=1 Tax=Halomonas caseinilytica TaxID=438744 RepID=UPI001113CDFA|nr:hypothetical protein [Halomonas caseinilytica]
MFLRLLIGFAVAALLGWATHGRLEEFSREDFSEILSVLLNVSSIIFAIIGAWIAIIYPNAIKDVGHHDREDVTQTLNESVKDANYLSELFQIVLLSSVVIVSVIVIKVALPILKAYTYFGIEVSVLKSLSVAAALFLTFAQINSISVVVEKNFHLLQRIRDKVRKERVKNDS